MKIVHFSSGLGNQIFFYLFSCYLQEKYPKQMIYGYYPARNLKKHSGLEIANVFDVCLPAHTVLSDLVAWFCRKINGIGIKGLKATDNNFLESAIYFDGYYHDKCFIEGFESKLRFREFELDKINYSLKQQIEACNSVSIHIRRGDYLLPEINRMFGGICTIEYYKQAIEVVREKITNSMFFVFSNDMDWVKDNLRLENAVYVTNNFGANSYLDMYLMSLCRANIIANSTFSYWAAMLNKNNPVVIYPQKWNHLHTPDMFPDNWIGL